MRSHKINARTTLRQNTSLDANEKGEIFRAFLESQNARDIEIMDVKSSESITDVIMVAGATSRRHAQGLADGISRICKENDFEFLGMEGYNLADWILVDCNDVIVNIFQEEPRKLYRLEDLWRRNLQIRKKENIS